MASAPAGLRVFGLFVAEKPRYEAGGAPEWRNGRRSGFKIRRGKPRVSSNLTSGTIAFSVFVEAVFDLAFSLPGRIKLNIADLPSNVSLVCSELEADFQMRDMGEATSQSVARCGG